MSENTLTQPRARLHPLVAGAAAAVIIASAVGIAAMTGNLPGSKAQNAEPPQAPVSKTGEPVAQAVQPVAKAHQPAKPVQVASAAKSVAQAKPHCANCGVVLGVKEVEVKGEGSGVGAVAGGVAGGVLAHEVFDGKNQGLATIAGAAGGAFAGNAIEKNVKTKKHYDVAVRMGDGTTKTLAYAEPPSWKAGDKVKVEGTRLTPQ